MTNYLARRIFCQRIFPNKNIVYWKGLHVYKAVPGTLDWVAYLFWKRLLSQNGNVNVWMYTPSTEVSGDGPAWVRDNTMWCILRLIILSIILRQKLSMWYNLNAFIHFLLYVQSRKASVIDIADEDVQHLISCI